MESKTILKPAKPTGITLCIFWKILSIENQFLVYCIAYTVRWSYYRPHCMTRSRNTTGGNRMTKVLTLQGYLTTPSGWKNVDNQAAFSSNDVHNFVWENLKAKEMLKNMDTKVILETWSICFVHFSKSVGHFCSSNLFSAGFKLVNICMTQWSWSLAQLTACKYGYWATLLSN